ncbi:rhodanese-like domain-containing protein [Mycoplasmatota bacterium WC44]
MNYVLGTVALLLVIIVLRSFKNTSGVNHMNSDEFKTSMRNGTILDVRTKNEFKTGHIQNAICIPVNTLMNNLSKLDKSKPIYVYCASGSRSSSAARYLVNNGYEVFNLRGGVNSYNGTLTRR